MKNLPNRLYLLNLEVTAKNVYMKPDFANKTVENFGTREPDKMRETINNLPKVYY